MRTPREAPRIACLALIAGCCSFASATTTDDIYAADPALRRFVDSQHGEALAIELGRLTYRKRWSGEDPYVTVGKAMNFLFTDGGMAKTARRLGSGSVADGSGVIEPRALPYHMTVVMIEPTIIVMNFDLGALVHEGEVREGPVVGTPYIDGYLTYGTHVPATGSLLWFSPDAKVAPTAVPGQASGHAEIAVSGHGIALERKGAEWIATSK
jgi:hypothetical protein